MFSVAHFILYSLSLLEWSWLKCLGFGFFGFFPKMYVVTAVYRHNRIAIFLFAVADRLLQSSENYVENELIFSNS